MRRGLEGNERKLSLWVWGREHLQKASRNHLRAFAMELKRVGGAYPSITKRQWQTRCRTQIGAPDSSGILAIRSATCNLSLSRGSVLWECFLIVVACFTSLTSQSSFQLILFQGTQIMACDINGSGCKVCPGMWIAGLLLLVMTLQSIFFRAPTPSDASSANSTGQSQPSNGISDTPE